MDVYQEPKSEYKTRYGVDWPAQMHDILIELTIAKKWRQFKKDLGIEFKDPHDHMLRAARALLPPSKFRVSPWTEQHFHGFVNYDKFIVWGCASSSKSNDLGLLLLLDWLVDPYDTVTLVGSTSKEDLKSRSWESIVRYHQELKTNSSGFIIPGRISRQGQSLINEVDDSVSGSMGDKAGIHGRAINEDGRLQGAHAPYVRLFVDELAAINRHDVVRTGMTNLRIGSIDFRFLAAANPEDWSNESCRYCDPQDGAKVDVDTGAWVSTFGAYVLHHDALKSPCILDPSKEKEFPFLFTQAQLDEIVREANGNMDSPVVWKMVRGFPMPKGNSSPVVLDPKIADANHVTEAPINYGQMPARFIASAAGCDPAWSEGGDDAVWSQVRVMEMNGRVLLDFSGGTSCLPIKASSPMPVTQQLREGVIAKLRAPTGAPSLQNVAVDSSGNQGLADDLDVYLGCSCLHVNNSKRASDAPLRAYEPRPAMEMFYDRGTESWAVLAEFCRADMVRGLPQKARDALTSRTYATKAGSKDPIQPLRMIPKEQFIKTFKGSPNEADACALAALAVKERLGILPFAATPPPGAQAILGPGTPWVPRLEYEHDVPEQPGGYAPDFGAIGLYEPP